MTTIDRLTTTPDQLLTYKQLAEWLNDSTRHLRRLGTNTRSRTSKLATSSASIGTRLPAGSKPTAMTPPTDSDQLSLELVCPADGVAAFEPVVPQPADTQPVSRPGDEHVNNASPTEDVVVRPTKTHAVVRDHEVVRLARRLGATREADDRLKILTELS